MVKLAGHQIPHKYSIVRSWGRPPRSKSQLSVTVYRKTWLPIASQRAGQAVSFAELLIIAKPQIRGDRHDLHALHRIAGEVRVFAL